MENQISSQPKKSVSIIIPAYNEEGNVPLITAALKDLVAKLPRYAWEVFFVDDGSRDRTSEAVLEEAEKDSRIHLVQFSRNFGKEAATSAGICEASGDACIMIDADLQHPIELIPRFLEKWEAGADVVIGIRENNAGGSFIKKIGSHLFNKGMAWLSDTEIIPNSTDFRLLDRTVMDEFKRFTERSRMTRGLIDWLGFKRDFVSFQANERQIGVASYSFRKLVKLAVEGFISHSLLPLKIAGYLGVLIVVTFGPFGFFVFMGKYVFSNEFAESFTGPAQLAILIIFLVGVILSALGLTAYYIGYIYKEAINRPLYVVRKRK